MEAVLYLIPVSLGDTDFSKVLPAYNRKVILSLRSFIVENRRSARRFLKKIEPSIVIDNLNFYELNEQTTTEAITCLLLPMEKGESIGLMSEAGCPAVADPGAAVVALAQRKGYRVRSLVGPSSLLLALMASGLNGQRFAFHGYLPVDAIQRAECIKALEARMYAEDETQVFMETPYRNNRLLADIVRLCRPSTQLCIASELTTEGETIKTLPVRVWAKNLPDLNKKPTIFLIGGTDAKQRDGFSSEKQRFFQHRETDSAQRDRETQRYTEKK